MTQSRTIRYQMIKASVGSIIVGMAAFNGLMEPVTFGLAMIGLNVVDSLISTKLRYMTNKPMDERDA